ncbi:glutamyl-tRNA amidotransferase [Sulfolobales archaeon HS-7]|nr:glutamyl-tRNA amidotransferase [Sulfolobales archaeon HS-7]
MVKIGLEVHVHLNTLNTKLFCSCSSNYEDKEPNTNVCPVCLGLPGALPVVNERALTMAVMVATALHMEISHILSFSRKHYFYPDMSKNYQITQYDGPGSTAIAYNGWIEINGKKIRIRRINIEEDPAKSIYPTGSILTSKYTLLDYNRSGIGLLEIVTEPDLENPKEARQFMEVLRSILEHLDVTNFELEGAMRADCNVSVEGGERVEVKNVGSPKDAEAAIAYEIARQNAALRSGVKIRRETRHWDSIRKVTVPLRSKETEEDYRYFPDPDLPPYYIPHETIDKIIKSMPELPESRIDRLIKQYGLDEYQAQVLVYQKQLADFFEEAAKEYKQYKRLANVIINEVQRRLNEREIELKNSKLSTEHLIKVLAMEDNGSISVKTMKDLIPKIIDGIDPEQYVIQNNLLIITDVTALENVINSVISKNIEVVRKAKQDPKVVDFLVGMVMKEVKKRANPKQVYELIQSKLREIS